MILMCRDCLRFAFMDILQKELDCVKDMWNTHLIRKSRRDILGGIPDALYFIPTIYGNSSFSV